MSKVNRVALDTDSTFVKRFKGLIGETKKLDKVAQDLEVSRPTISNWLNGKCVPNQAAALKIAEHYNVSVNWLQGISNNPTTDTSVEAICNYTGLSEKAVLKLAELHGRHIDCIDLLLTNPNFDMLPIALGDYLPAKLTLDKSIKEFANILQKNNIEIEDDIIKQAAKISYQALTEPNASILKIAEYSSKVTKNKDKMQYTEYMVQQSMVKILSEYNKEGE